MKKTLSIILALVFGMEFQAYAYRDLETGVFLTKDPEGFVNGPNQYTYVNQNPWTKFDPEGLKECVITNAQAEKLKDSSGEVNKIVNAAIQSVLADVKAGKIKPNEAKEALYRKITQPAGDSYGNDSHISQQIAALGAAFYLPASSAGTKYDGGLKFKGMITYPDNLVLAGGINLKGQAVGTDKLDHIFVDGYQMSNVQLDNGKIDESARRAKAETQSKINEVNMCGLANTGVFSNGDIAANMIGYDFYNNFEAAAVQGKDFTWDISKQDVSKLNENVNKNSYTPAVKKQVEENEKKFHLNEEKKQNEQQPTN